jgi:hypothetical protein
VDIRTQGAVEVYADVFGLFRFRRFIAGLSEESASATAIVAPREVDSDIMIVADGLLDKWFLAVNQQRVTVVYQCHAPYCLLRNSWETVGLPITIPILGRCSFGRKGHVADFPPHQDWTSCRLQWCHSRHK